jgi:ubiquinone/menaquinone biosynthesis C-methylase UbiE/DNA-binding MarR family transcriptional regulator
MAASLIETIKLLTEPTRLRILLLLETEELSVAELQDVISAGQSTVSTHLAQLKRAGLVEDRRTGKSTQYRIVPKVWAQLGGAIEVLRQAAQELPELADDEASLALVLRKRQDKIRAYFDELAGKFGRHYVPGRSWKGLAEMLLALMPPLTIADLGAGEGTVSQLLASRAAKVIAVDNSEKMVEFGAELARKHGIQNLEYRVGELEQIPIDDASVDLALFSQSLHHAQHPAKAVAEASRILKPGGRIAVLDLARHHFEQAREMYADIWLGFHEAELRTFLTERGFVGISSAVVHREEESPHFETLLVVGTKPG